MSCVPLAKVLGLIEEASAAMQGGDEEDAILVLQLVVQLSQQFPVGIINQDQDSRPPVGKRVVRMQGVEGRRLSLWGTGMWEKLSSHFPSK